MLRKFLLFFILLHIGHDLLSQTTYYISSKGSDNNNGKSPNCPWKTLKSITPGNTYLFKRGDVFNFSIPSVDNPTNKIILAAYGQGKKPLINLYTHINEKRWTKHSDKVWKIDLRIKTNFSGFLNFNSNIGFLKVDGKIFGYKIPGIELLANQWDFYSDEFYLYVYSAYSPSNSSIKFSSNGIGVQLSSNMIVRDLKITGSGGHGVQGRNLKNVRIERVEISEIGGAYLPGFGDGKVRYGNGIEFWNGSENCKVKGCNVTQVYDAAYTLQGIGAEADFRNTIFRKNFADKNEQSFEVWAREGAPGFTTCRFMQNKCFNAGYGWSHEVRPSKNEAVHLLSYTWDVQNTDLLIENNMFYKAKSGLYYHNINEKLPPFTSKNNIIYLNHSVPIRVSFPEYNIKSSSGFTVNTGKEAASKFKSVGI
jgi:hypothetical protein